MSALHDIALVDDYGHHPAEVQATLLAARNAYPGRVLVAFQPHRYTRTQQLFDDFTRAFNDADRVFLVDVYAAGETPIPGADSSHLAAAITRHGHHGTLYVQNKNGAAELLAQHAEPGDVVIALGAGDINKILPDIKERLAARYGNQVQ